MRSEKTKTTSENKLKQIVYVWNYLEWGGAQVYFLGLASRLKDRIDVKFVFPKGTSSQFINFCEKKGIPYELLETAADLKTASTFKRKVERHINKFRTEFETLRFINKYISKNTIIHIEIAPWQSALALIWLCARSNVYLTMHNALPPVSKWRFYLWKLKFYLVTKFRTFHIFASNQDAKNSLKPFVSESFFEKTKVTYTNVNPDEIDEALEIPVNRRILLDKFGLPSDKFLVFCLGQFIDRKGRWIFLEAAKKVSSISDNVAFVWISNSVLSDDEHKQIEKYDLDGIFHLIKSESVGKEHLELMKFLRLADVFTLPSFVEGLPISLLEAMALCIPSISTNVYAIPEAVKDDRTGKLIEAGDSDALAKAIIELKNDKELRKTLAENGREFVLAHFNEELVAEIAYQGYLNAIENS